MNARPRTPRMTGGGEDPKQVFAMRLRDWRRETGMSQRQVSDLTGLTEQTVFNWEQGRSLPSYDAMRKLVITTGISADWWLGLSDYR